MYAGKLSYFVQIQAQYELSALSSKAKTGLLAGKGIFGYEPKVDYFFGLPRSISSGGIHLDIETTRVVRALDNDQQKTIDFAIQTGPIGSALEHALKEVPLGCQVPEQMFNTDPNNPTQGISTVKALQLANAQGQQIYKIDQTNIDTVLPKLNLSDSIKQDIQSSVNVGKYVITHTDNVSVPGWSGAGYAIIDPLTGSDAYMISGGENGGAIPDWAANALTAVVGIGSLFAVTFAFHFILVVVTLALVLDTYGDYLELMIQRDAVSGKCIDFAVNMTWLIGLLSVVGFIAPIFMAAMLILYSYIATQIGSYVISNICPYAFFQRKYYKYEKKLKVIYA